MALKMDSNIFALVDSGDSTMFSLASFANQISSSDPLSRQNFAQSCRP
jgi:hypothetical protein